MMPTQPFEVLHYLREVVRTTNTAWHAASNGGTAHVQAVLNGLATLENARTPEGMDTPAGALSATHGESCAALERLRVTVSRLRSGARGVERWASEISEQSNIGDAASLFAAALSTDAADKASVLAEIENAITDARAVPSNHAAKLIARWVEQPARATALEADVLVALIDAHEMLLRAQFDTDASLASPVLRTPPFSRTATKPLSPALAMLKHISDC